MHAAATQAFGSRSSVSRDRAREPQTEDLFKPERLPSLFRKTWPVSPCGGSIVQMFKREAAGKGKENKLVSLDRFNGCREYLRVNDLVGVSQEPDTRSKSCHGLITREL